MKYLSILVLFFMPIAGNTLPLKGFPKGCEAIGFLYDNQNVVFNQQGDQTIYFIQNVSNSIIELKNANGKNNVVDMGWRTTLAKRRWASFAMNDKDMLFSCQAIDKGKVNPVSCMEVIRICQYPRVQFSHSNQGTYWISRNKSLDQAVRKAINKGILLRW